MVGAQGLIPALIATFSEVPGQAQHLTKIYPGRQMGPTPFDKNTRGWARPHLAQLRGPGFSAARAEISEAQNLTKIRPG